MGAVFHPLGVGIAAASGATLGELTGYMAGFSGQAVMENTRVYDRLLDWTRRFGGLTIIALAAIPNPLFDLAGIAAGALRMPLGMFLLYTWIGKMIKMVLAGVRRRGVHRLAGSARTLGASPRTPPGIDVPRLRGSRPHP